MNRLPLSTLMPIAIRAVLSMKPNSIMAARFEMQFWMVCWIQLALSKSVFGGSAEYLWEFSEKSGMTIVHAEDVPHMGIPALVEKAKEVVGGGPVYISFDIDGVDPSFAPGTGDA